MNTTINHLDLTLIDYFTRTSLVVQWLRLHTPTVRDTGLIPG